MAAAASRIAPAIEPLDKNFFLFICTACLSWRMTLKYIYGYYIEKRGEFQQKSGAEESAKESTEESAEESGAYRKILTFPWVPSIIILGAIEKSEDGDSSSASGG